MEVRSATVVYFSGTALTAARAAFTLKCAKRRPSYLVGRRAPA